MIENHERLAILRLIQADRPTTRQSLQMAALYAGQVLLASYLLMFGYAYFHLPAALWAVVSAVLVVQPVVEQSLAASAVRIAANTVGGVTGIIVAHVFGDGAWQVLLAIAVVVLICERLRLDLGLRTACVSVVIIMMKGGPGVFSTGEQRLAAVVVGCIVALGVQIVAEMLRRKLGWTSPTVPSAMPANRPADGIESTGNAH